MFLTLTLLAAAGARPPVASEMHDRYALLSEARNFVIHGDLPKAREAGRDLASIEASRRLPRAWRPWVERLEVHAQALAEAPDLVQAAAQVGQAAATCGGCHAANRGGPSLEHTRDIPAQAWEEGMNMPLHQWAADWMWLGLVAYDDEAWARGAEELDRTPLTYRFEGAEGHKPQLEQIVYVLAERALTEDAANRGTLMGQFLATCAECHVRPGTARAKPEAAADPDPGTEPANEPETEPEP